MVVYHILQAMGVVAILTWFMVPVPFLSYKQGKKSKDSGVVTSIKKLKLGAYYVGLTQGLKVDPRCLQGGVTMMSGSMTRYVTFRFWQSLPKLGDTVETETQNRNYPLRSRSYNWVSSWKHVDKVSPGGLITMVDAGPKFNGDIN